MANREDREHPSDSEDEYDSVDGAAPVRRTIMNPSKNTSDMHEEYYDAQDRGFGAVPSDNMSDKNSDKDTGDDYDTVDSAASFLSPAAKKMKTLFAKATKGVYGGKTDAADVRETMLYSDEEDERVEPEVCECGGDGSCVRNVFENGRTTDRPDAILRTETANKTGNELIQKHVMVANRPVHSHSSKDLFSHLHRSRRNLSIVWLKENSPQTFLHTAVINRRPEIIPTLVDCGLLLDLFDCPVHDPHCDYTGYTAMQIAELHKNEVMINLLKQQKLFAESFGWMHACARDGNIDGVESLLRKHPSLLNKPIPPVQMTSTTVQQHSGTEPIYWAVTSGSSKLVKLLLEKGANVHSTSSEGETLLTRAVSLGHLKIVQLLVSTYNMDTNEPGYEQKTCLQRAIANKDVAMVKLLIDLGAQIPDPMMNDVAKSGHVQMFSHLRSYVHNLDIQDEFGKFPLYYAIQQDNLQMAEELIKAGAKLTLKDRQQRNLLHLAVSRKNQETFDFLLRHLKQKKNNRKKTLLSELINQRDRYVGGERCFLVRGKDNGTAAYHYVNVNRFHISLFRQMTRAGTVIDVVKYGSIIESGWGVNPKQEVVDSVEKRYDISKVTDRSQLDLTPLNLAILKENHQMALELIASGADINMPDCFGLTPLHMACVQGSLEVVVRLEKTAANMNATDQSGHTPLDAAKENQHHHVVNFIQGREIIQMKDLEKFRKTMAELKEKLTLAKLQESRGEGVDIKQQLIQDLRKLQGEVNALCYSLGKGPVMEETHYGSVTTESQPHYASQC